MLLVAVLPPIMIAQVPLAEAVPELLPRPAVYLSSALALWALTLLAALAVWASGFDARTLGLVVLPPGELAAWTLGITLTGLAVQVAGRVLRFRESPILLHLLPRTRKEKAAFGLLSLSAGIGEELVFRSFLIPTLTLASGSAGVALLVSSTLFGLLHAYQRVVGALRAAALGAVLGVPFLLCGSVLPSMLAHTALDLLAGLWLADWLTRR